MSHVASDDLPAATFFEPPQVRVLDGAEVEWITPTDFSRGPWDPSACHGGPPTAMLARASERAVPAMPLVRITVDLVRPIPMAGFHIEATVTRAGRAVTTTALSLLDQSGVVRATATGLHIATASDALFPTPLDNSGIDWPELAAAEPGKFPIKRAGHDLPLFSAGVRNRYPAGEDDEPGATTVWMRTIPLIDGEDASPFQRICPLADCGNAFSRHAEPDGLAFVNPDLTVSIHRPPVGDWFGMHTSSQWQPAGVGLATSLLFDDQGPVGLSTQTMLLRRI